MRKLLNFQLKSNDKIIAIPAALTVFFMNNPVYAQVKLTNAKTALEALRDDLKTLIPIAAAVILLGLAIGYAGRYIGKDTFVRWGIGVVVGGSAIELANLLLTP
ncbi:VirB2 family type IV secretion system major pilin TrwL [Bartonella sp. AP58NXGY]|uniref:VirB2 family type IV secretion system major pilin TrwL n=1 Tax=Bartonella sp. AP58NXGY TaxID=3243498 RepID=UPI0035CF02ED